MASSPWRGVGGVRRRILGAFFSAPACPAGGQGVRRSVLGRLEPLEQRHMLSVGGVQLGQPTDFFEQPYVDVRLYDPATSTSLGPTGEEFGGIELYRYSHLLLDTGANSILFVSNAAQELVANGMVDAGDYRELGVAGYTEFDVSAPYQIDVLRIAGLSGVETPLFSFPVSADQNRILYSPSTDLGGLPAAMGGIPGIAGMPLMADRVTTLDMSSLAVGADLWQVEEMMQVDFSDTVPAASGHRYSVPVDTRVVFDPRAGLIDPDDPTPIWAPIPFLDVTVEANGARQTGSFLLDTGAQASVISTRLAFALGLDENNNGTLDDEALDFLDIGGIGGTVRAPILVLDRVGLPTEEGVDLSWSGGPDGLALGVIVHDIAEGIDGVLGVDLLTTGMISDYNPDDIFAPWLVTQAPFFRQIHFDFRDIRSGAGTMYVDLQPEYDVFTPADPAVAVVGGGVTLAATEGGPATGYALALDTAPSAPVVVTLLADPLDVLLSPTTLTFDATNWDEPQWVTVTAADDAAHQPARTAVISQSAASDDPGYQGLSLPSLRVNVQDNDPQGPVVTIVVPAGEHPEGLPVSLSATVTGAGDPQSLTYAWTITQAGQPVTTGSGAEFLFTPPDNGPYDIALEVSDGGTPVGSDTAVVSAFNVWPVAAITGAPADAFEGTSLTLGSTVTDAGSGDTVASRTWSVTRGGLPYASGSGAEFTFTPDDNGTYLVAFTATDDDGDSDTATATIVVLNVAPALSGLSAGEPVVENGQAIVSGQIADPGAADGFTVLIDWGEGTESFALPAGATSFSRSHVYRDDNPTGTAADDYTIRVTVTDKDGGSDTASTVATVRNVAPTVAIVDSPADSPEGTEIVLRAEVTDPGTQDTFTYAWTVTKDGSPFATGSDATLRFTPDHEGDYQVSLEVRDDDSGVGSAAASVAVGNVAPRLAGLRATSGDENGRPVVVSGDILDPGLLDSFTVTIDWGDGPAERLTYAAGTTSFSASHRYLDDDPSGTPADTYTVVVTLADDAGATDQAQVAAEVRNVAPVVTIEGVPERVRAGNLLTLASVVVDPGVRDTHHYVWTVFRDGQIVGGGSDVGLSYTPPVEGFYTISLTVTDDDGGQAGETASVLVDPPGLGLGSLAVTPEVFEGGELVVQGSINDPENPGGSGPYRLEIAWGDGTSDTFDAGATFTRTHRYADNGPAVEMPLEVRLNGADPARTATRVLNAAPLLATGSGKALLWAGGSSSQPLISFTDGGRLDTHTAQIDWGDGVGLAATVQQSSSGGGTVLASVPRDGIYSATVRVRDDDGGESSAGLQVYAAKLLGRIDDRTVDDVDPMGGTRLFAFETTRAGYITAEAVEAGQSSNVSLTLYDSNLNLLTTSTTVNGRTWLDWGQAGALTTYFVAISGDGFNVDLRLANLVSYAAGVVTVHGTAAADQFRYEQGLAHSVTVNGLPYQFSRGYTTRIDYRDGGPNDRLTLQGGDLLTEAFVLRRESASYTLGSFQVTAAGMGTIEAVASGPEDTLTLYDSGAADLIEVRPQAVSTMTDEAASYHLVGQGFQTISVMADGGGRDRATLHDTPAGGERAIVRAASRRTSLAGALLIRVEEVTVLFDQGGTDDRIAFYDSAVPETFTASYQSAVLVNAIYRYEARGFQEAHAFALVHLVADGRTPIVNRNVALLTDSPAADQFRAAARDSAVLTDDEDLWDGTLDGTYFLRADGFDEVTATASVADAFTERAWFFGTRQNDVFIGDPLEASLAVAGLYRNVARAFGDVRAFGKSGLGDRAEFHGGNGPDYFLVNSLEGSGKLSGYADGEPYFLKAFRFDHYFADAGADGWGSADVMNTGDDDHLEIDGRLAGSIADDVIQMTSWGTISRTRMIVRTVTAQGFGKYEVGRVDAAGRPRPTLAGNDTKTVRAALDAVLLGEEDWRTI